MASPTPNPTPGFVRAARYAGVGFEFGGIIVAGVVVGQYLDGCLGTEPLMILAFTLGGFVGAVYRLIWSLKRNTSP